MKKVVLIVVILMCCYCVKAQKLFFVFGHAEYASPVGKLRNANNSGAGIEVGAGLGTNKTFITGTIGTTWLAANKQAGNTSLGGLRYTPYKLGLRRYILLKNLFVKGEAGLATMKYIDADGKTSKLTTSFGAGLKFTTFEALLDYNSVASYGSWVGIKFGLAIGL